MLWLSGPVGLGFVAIVHVFLLLLTDRFFVCGYGSVEYESGMVLRNCISEASDFILVWFRGFASGRSLAKGTNSKRIMLE